jgi:phosphopantothenoylcysteine synthetase/decarboxylase
MNENLWRHPTVNPSVAILRHWDIRVLEPQDTGNGLMMAPADLVITTCVADRPPIGTSH